MKDTAEDISHIFSTRKRTNLLRVPEQVAISFFVRRIPRFITSDMLTGMGFLGSLCILTGFLLAIHQIHFLFLCVIGLFINWFGDSLDGRLAYYRNKPRKWYGYSLDIIMDWIDTVLIGVGYYFYAADFFKIVAFILVILYGWAMIIAQLRYKVTNHYDIDSGIFGPTEMRIALAIVIVLEFFFPQTLGYFAGGICLVLFLLNVIDSRKLLNMGNERDAFERETKQKQAS